MVRHIVQPGEHLARIGAAHGYDLETIYEHPQNRELRAKRPSPHLLHPGDVVWIPDEEPAGVEVPTEAVHTFVLERRPIHLRVVVQDADRNPLSGAEWTLEVAGETKTGATGGDGKVEAEVPADAAEGFLTIGGRRLHLHIGHLNPMDDTPDEGVSGVEARLANLGYYGGPITGSVGEELLRAMRRFRRDHGLSASDEIDGALKAELARKHGG